MQRHDQEGTVNTLAVIATLSLLFIIMLVFALWAYSGKQSYKTKFDQKVAQAVAQAQKDQAEQDQKKLDEALKSPSKTYAGPVTYGSVSFSYPKSWSAYIDESSNSQPINGYFYPDKVPGVNNNVAYALRVELVNTPYSQVVHQYDSDITSGTVTAVAFVPPKLKLTANVLPGVKLDGSLGSGQNSQKQSMVIIQVRDKTLVISSEAPNFFSDFNNVVLPSLTFAP